MANENKTVKRKRRTKAEIEAEKNKEVQERVDKVELELSKSSNRYDIINSINSTDVVCNTRAFVESEIKKLFDKTNKDIVTVNKRSPLSNSDKEELKVLKGTSETFRAMVGILGHNYGTSTVYEYLNNTKKQVIHELCMINCKLVGNARKPTELKDRLCTVVGQYRAIEKIKGVLDDAFTK